MAADRLDVGKDVEVIAKADALDVLDGQVARDHRAIANHRVWRYREGREQCHNDERSRCRDVGCACARGESGAVVAAVWLAGYSWGGPGEGQGQRPRQ